MKPQRHIKILKQFHLWTTLLSVLFMLFSFQGRADDLEPGEHVVIYRTSSTDNAIPPLTDKIRVYYPNQEGDWLDRADSTAGRFSLESLNIERTRPNHVDVTARHFNGTFGTLLKQVQFLNEQWAIVGLQGEQGQAASASEGEAVPCVVMTRSARLNVRTEHNVRSQIADHANRGDILGVYDTQRNGNNNQYPLLWFKISPTPEENLRREANEAPERWVYSRYCKNLVAVKYAYLIDPDNYDIPEGMSPEDIEEENRLRAEREQDDPDTQEPEVQPDTTEEETPAQPDQDDTDEEATATLETLLEMVQNSLTTNRRRTHQTLRHQDSQQLIPLSDNNIAQAILDTFSHYSNTQYPVLWHDLSGHMFTESKFQSEDQGDICGLMQMGSSAKTDVQDRYLRINRRQPHSDFRALNVPEEFQPSVSGKDWRYSPDNVYYGVSYTRLMATSLRSLDLLETLDGQNRSEFQKFALLAYNAGYGTISQTFRRLFPNPQRAPAITGLSQRIQDPGDANYSLPAGQKTLIQAIADTASYITLRDRRNNRRNVAKDAEVKRYVPLTMFFSDRLQNNILRLIPYDTRGTNEYQERERFIENYFQ